MSPQLYLASGSPRRRELLVQLGVTFDVLRPDVAEQQQPNEDATLYVQRLARDKARAGAALAVPEDRPVLAGDTIVVLDGSVLEKPRDQADGMDMLRRLSGRSHLVLTAMALLANAKLSEVLVSTQVTFRVLTEADIEGYWHSGEPIDKAGGYGIQGAGGSFVVHINGSYSSVVGLPLVETRSLLQAAGLLAV
ncbi:nucleoside triphosphate pyrophosphatase [Oceanisphaera sp. IT1-181]|uniref:Maf family protein n=1 Tax=Oceanisphaera sp. IT1-181 TaxID=3081199 RepID=UPI0029CA5032|nr:nucleoside triphosphate pyrophosphatase [Oceanisphaera sp. IT1-181]